MGPLPSHFINIIYSSNSHVLFKFKIVTSHKSKKGQKLRLQTRNRNRGDEYYTLRERNYRGVPGRLLRLTLLTVKQSGHKVLYEFLLQFSIQIKR